MITLLMLSGGIDSTYLLYKLLRESDDTLHVHHVHLMTDLGRHVPEASACKQIVDYCRKNVRPFSYSESAIDHRGFQCHGYDLIAAGLEAGVVASSYYMATKKHIDRWTVGIALGDHVPLRRLDDAQACCKANCQNGASPEFHLFRPLADVTSSAAYLPAELFNLTWSCRSPARVGENIKPCGKCFSCLRREPIECADASDPGSSTRDMAIRAEAVLSAS